MLFILEAVVVRGRLKESESLKRGSGRDVLKPKLGKSGESLAQFSVLSVALSLLSHSVFCHYIHLCQSPEVPERDTNVPHLFSSLRFPLRLFSWSRSPTGLSEQAYIRATITQTSLSCQNPPKHPKTRENHSEMIPLVRQRTPYLKIDRLHPQMMIT